MLNFEIMLLHRQIFWHHQKYNIKVWSLLQIKIDMKIFCEGYTL